MRGAWLLAAVLVAAMPIRSAAAQTAEQQVTFPERPGEDQFVVDEAELIQPADREAIEATCAALRADKEIPLLVVTVRSLAEHGVEHGDIERFAQSLFDDWGIGLARWSNGVLVLVSAKDRKSRIEMGRDWNHRHDLATQQIMAEVIVPAFIEGDYSRGLRSGVAALDRMLRGEAPAAGEGPAAGVGGQPARPTGGSRSRRHAETYDQPGSAGGGMIAVGLVVVLLLVWTVVSGIRRGTTGTAWRFWRVMFEVLFFILRVLVVIGQARGRSSSSWSSGSSSYRSGSSSYRSGSSSRSFGGGSSGGGGASGSW